MKEVRGNTDGVKTKFMELLIQLYDLRVPPWQLVSKEIAIRMAEIN